MTGCLGGGLLARIESDICAQLTTTHMICERFGPPMMVSPCSNRRSVFCAQKRGTLALSAPCVPVRTLFDIHLGKQC